MQTSPDGTLTGHGVWKRFRSDQRDTLLSDELQRVLRRRDGSGRWRWVLRDINFDIRPGESVALIGHNGSGKTTLLKLMTKVMHPYAGHVEVTGRVGALIEVTSGIHPDLSGRENIILYGSLLGVSRKRMVERLDEIVEFAELGAAVDRLVKYYSWGMKMRLGFAVAAFLEPDVLLVDEVLAVGDARFQQKCLTRMRQVLQDGSTIVFVSHDLAAVEALCGRGLLLDQGVVKVDGTVREALRAYRADVERAASSEVIDGSNARVAQAAVRAPDGGPVTTSAPAEATIDLEVHEPVVGEIHLGISEGPAMPIFTVHTVMSLAAGSARLSCRFDSLPLPSGDYALWICIRDEVGHDVVPWSAAVPFTIIGEGLDSPPRGVMRLAPIRVDAAWEIEPT